jgi:hypothetical protein
LVKCEKSSAGKSYGTSGNKIGNAHLKWAFSEAAVLFLRGNEPAKKWLDRQTGKHGKGKAWSILAHKLGASGLLHAQEQEGIRQREVITIGREADQPDA